jgi:hypothetical protein
MTHTDKKEKKIFLIYKEIQMGAIAKSYVCGEGVPNYSMRKCANIYSYMRRPLAICNRSLLDFLYMRQIFFFFFYQ